MGQRRETRSDHHTNDPSGNIQRGVSCRATDTFAYNAIYVTSRTLLADQLKDEVLQRISLVKGGDFRQEEICKQWTEMLDAHDNKDKKLLVVTLRFVVSAGTYIRSICNKLGELTGTIARSLLEIILEITMVAMQCRKLTALYGNHCDLQYNLQYLIKIPLCIDFRYRTGCFGL